MTTTKKKLGPKREVIASPIPKIERMSIEGYGQPTTKYEFRDRGMPPLEMELTSSELEAELVKQGQRMNYTRVYDVSGARAKMIYVRALGQVEWRAWDAMDSLARSAWEEQDRG